MNHPDTTPVIRLACMVVLTAFSFMQVGKQTMHAQVELTK